MYRREKLDGKILLATHHRRFLNTLVLISAQMEQPMGEDTQKFLLKRDRKQFGIFYNSLNTNEYIPIQKLSLNIIKSDDVRQRVVIQILQIDLQKIIVITSIHAFDSIEITEIIKTSARLIEKLNRTQTDLLFINLDNKETKFAEIIKLVQRPPFIIGITDKKNNLQSFLDLGVFDFIGSSVEMEDICRKISKILYIYNCMSPKKEPQVNEALPVL